MILSGVGAEYFGCALVPGSFKARLFEGLCMGMIPMFTIHGMAYWPSLVAIIWAVHPLIDFLHHPAYFQGLAKALGVVKPHPKMPWYCAGCASFDIVQALLVQYEYCTSTFQRIPTSIWCLQLEQITNQLYAWVGE